MWKHLLVLAATALAGGLAGRAMAPRTTAAAAAAGPVTPPPEKEAPPPKWGKADFLKSSRELMAAIKAGTYDPYAEVFAPWSDDELREALNQSLTHPDCVLQFGGGRGTASALFRELLKRDFDAALAWFDSLPTTTARSRFAWTIGPAWPVARAEEGMAFLKSHRDIYSGSSGWAFLARGMEAAALKGPSVLNDFLLTLREEKFDLDFGNPIKFPEGFDFPALLELDEARQLDRKAVGKSFVRAWVEQDRDGAFKWLLANRGAGSLGLSPWAAGADSAGSIAWLGKQFEAMDSAQQAEYVAGSLDEWPGQLAHLKTFARDVKSPETLDKIRGIAVQSIYAGAGEQGMEALALLGSPEESLQVLETVGRADSVKDRRPLDPRREAVLRKKLAAWNASEERIEAIIARFKS